MGKIVLFLVAGILLLCGCTSLDSETLSESEKLTVVDMARYTITKMPKNGKFVNSMEASFINRTMPEVKVRYTGPRQGKMFISWTLMNKNKKNGKTVNFIYSGKFLTDDAMWRMGIVKHTYDRSKKRTNPYRKVRDVKDADFKELRKKSMIPGR